MGEPTRRDFLTRTGALAAGGWFGSAPLSGALAAQLDGAPDAGAIPTALRAPRQLTGRPPLAHRRFTSPAVERTIERVQAELADPELALLFENCFPNTLDTTVDVGEVDGQPDTFVITGDIDAMWLRDSTAQVWPYLQIGRAHV